MAFPTQPTEDPLWASTGTVTVPTLAKRMLGWIFQEKPPFDFFNWWMFRVYEWIVFLRGYLNVEHDITNGEHTTVNAQSLTTTGNVDVGAVLNVLAGTTNLSGMTNTGTSVLTGGVDATLGIDYAGVGSRNVQIDLGSYDKGGWILLSGTPVLVPAGAPPRVENAVGISSQTFAYMLDDLVTGPNDAVTGDQWTLNQALTNYRRNAAGDSFIVRVCSMARNGVAARTVETTMTLAVTGGVFAEATNTPTVSIDPARRYWVEVEFTTDVASAAGEAGHAGTRLRFARKRLE